MFRVFVVLSLAFTGLAMTGSASAHRHKPQHRGTAASTFTGSCQFSGSVLFRPPLTDTPSEGRDFATAAGPCSGSFTDRHGRVHELNGTTVKYFATDQGVTSCEQGTSLGGGFFVFPWGRLAFALTEARGPGAGTLQLSGRRGGLASGIAVVSASESPTQIAEECAGSGVRSVAVDIDLATTPSIAG